MSLSFWRPTSNVGAVKAAELVYKCTVKQTNIYFERTAKPFRNDVRFTKADEDWKR